MRTHTRTRSSFFWIGCFSLQKDLSSVRNICLIFDRKEFTFKSKDGHCCKRKPIQTFDVEILTVFWGNRTNRNFVEVALISSESNLFIKCGAKSFQRTSAWTVALKFRSSFLLPCHEVIPRCVACFCCHLTCCFLLARQWTKQYARGNWFDAR